MLNIKHMYIIFTFFSTLIFEKIGYSDSMAKVEDASVVISNRVEQRVFYPSVTSRTRTIGHLKFSWQPTPNSELNDFGWMNNNISMGLGTFLEVGFIPLKTYFLNAPNKYVDGNKFYHGIVKLNLIQNKRYNISFHYNYENLSVMMEPFEESVDGDLAPELIRVSNPEHHYAFLADYWFNQHHALAINLNYKYNDHISNWKEGQNNMVFNSNKWLHITGDYLISYSDSWKYTIGFSRRYARLSEEFKNLDLSKMKVPVLYGVGASVTWVRPGKTFSSINYGFHHYLEKKITKFIYGTSFY